MSNKWTEKEVNKLIKMNEEGYNYSEISKVINRSLPSCQQKGRKEGLVGDRNVNENFFKKDSEETYYVLGYWMADGYITNKSGGKYFGITSIDKEHLEKISKVMESKRKVSTRKDGHAHDIVIGNRHLVDSMVKMGCKYNKTHTMDLNDLEISDSLLFHFLRGFFDGDGGYTFQSHVKKDGTTTISSIRFTGTTKMMKSIHKRIGFGYISEEKRGGNCSYLSFYGNEMRELLGKMYKDSTIHLERKYEYYKNNGRLRIDTNKIYEEVI